MRARKAGLLVGAAGAAGAALQWRYLRRLASDPEHELLRDPPAGRPLRFTSADGTRLYAEEFGGGRAAPTIVLAHGWTEGISYWTFVIRELEPDFRVIAYELRGHGRSGPAAGGDYSLARFGEDLEAVLAGCLGDGERATVGGHSLGAMAIAAWAEHHDVRAHASGVALMNTLLGDLLAGQLLFPIPKFARRWAEPLALRAFLANRAPLPPFSTAIHDAMIRRTAFGPTATPARVALYQRLLRTCPPDARAACGVAMSQMELHHALANLDVPTLLLTSSDDRLTPASRVRRIARLLPELTELLELPATGHMEALERPVEVAAALRRLASRTPVAQPIAAA
jgi:pimeloyl-ACP methyl ester carboxylesterase